MHPATGSSWLLVLAGKRPTQTAWTWAWTLGMQTFHGLVMVEIQRRLTTSYLSMVSMVWSGCYKLVFKTDISSVQHLLVYLVCK